MNSTEILAERKAPERVDDTMITDCIVTLPEGASERTVVADALSPSNGDQAESGDDEAIDFDNISTRGSEPLADAEQDALFDRLGLVERHQEDLDKSGLDERMIERAGFKTVTAEQAPLFGHPPLGGMLIRYRGCSGYYRLRPDNPERDEGIPKYLSRGGSKNHLYIPPGVEAVLSDKSVPLFITEGEKKALKATQAGFPTIGLSGVWNWKTKDEGVLPEFRDIKWKGRTVYIVFDSDILENPEVQAALRALVRELERFRAEVRVALLPAGPDGEKVGLDDYLVAHGREEFEKLIAEASHLLDAVLTFIRPELKDNPNLLANCLEDVYWVAKMYPNSIPDHAMRIRERLTACGIKPPTRTEVIKAIKTVKPFQSTRTGAAEKDENPADTFAQKYAFVDDLEANDDRSQWGIFESRANSSERLTNFTVRQHTDIEVLDETEPGRNLELRLAGPRGISTVTVTAKHYADDKALMQTLYEAGGADLDIRCKASALRSAISSTRPGGINCKNEVTSRRVTRSLGWDNPGNYVTPGGVVTEDGWRQPGQSVVLPDGTVTTLPEVDLAGLEKAQHLGLRRLDNADLLKAKEFVGHELVNLQPRVITYACLGLVGLAPLYRFVQGYNRFGLWLLGMTGTGKSFLARLAQCFYGDFSNPEHVMSWGSTAKAIQEQGYYFKDAIYLVDDYKSSVIRPSEIIPILQNYADGTGRGRLRRDGSLNRTRPIRGMMLCTGEDLPEYSASTIARMIVLRAPNNEPDLSLGHKCLRHASMFPGVTEAFLEEIFTQDWRSQFPDMVNRYHEEFIRDIRGRDNAVRIAGNFAMLAAGFQAFALFMGDVWPNAQERVEAFVADLHGVRDQMLNETHEQSPSQVLLTKLRALLDSGEAVLLPQDALPDKSSKPVVGYFLKQTGHIGLNVDTAILMIEQMLPDKRFPCSKNTLLNQLEHEGVIVDKSRQVRASGERPRLAVVKRSALFDDDSPVKLDNELFDAEACRQQDAFAEQVKNRSAGSSPI